MDLGDLTVDHFKPAVGSTFALGAAYGSKLELELIDAQTYPPDAGPNDESGKRTPFGLTFRGPAEPILPQQIYPLEHRDVGALELFIVPIGVDAAGTRYEAIFS